jgi:Acetyltransferase (GNAT) domain
MIRIDRKLLGIVPYRTVFFPSDSDLAEMGERLKPGSIGKLFWTIAELRNSRCVVSRHSGATVCTNLSDTLDSLFKHMAKNTRYEIRQTERLGSRVKIARNSSETWRDFLGLYQELAGAKSGVAPINSAILARYRPYSECFIASLDERPMCGHVFLRDTRIGRARLLFSANRRLANSETALICGRLNRMLHWHEIRLYREEGFKIYDLGGIREDSSDGIAQFKKSFGGEVVKEYTYLCVGPPWLGRIAQHFTGVG